MMKASYIKPLLPLRDIVIFPSMVVPLFVGREKSIKALQEVMKSDKSIVLITQKNSEIDDPEEKDLFGYGCLSFIIISLIAALVGFIEHIISYDGV